MMILKKLQIITQGWQMKCIDAKKALLYLYIIYSF